MASLPLLAVFESCCRCDLAAIDPRSVPITISELTEAASKPDTTAVDEQLIVIGRGASCNTAYRSVAIFDAVANKLASDPYAQLFAGVANEQAFYYSVRHSRSPEAGDEMQKVMDGTGKYLARAYQTGPHIPIVEAEYGFYLSQFGGDQVNGKRQTATTFYLGR